MTTTPPRPDHADAGDEVQREAQPQAQAAQAQTAQPQAQAQAAQEARGEADPSWQAVGERRRPSRIALSYVVPLVAATVVGQVGGRVLVRGIEDPDWPVLAAAGALMVATVLVGYALVALVLRLAYGPARVDLRRGLLRAGRRTVPLTDVTWAKVVVRDPAGRTPVAVLTFGAEGGPRVAVPVRDVRGAVATEEQRAVVAAALARTSITVPRSAADPTGRFTRYNFPGRVSKDDAIALVEHPTERDDLLPESAGAALEQARVRDAQRRDRRERKGRGTADDS